MRRGPEARVWWAKAPSRRRLEASRGLPCLEEKPSRKRRLQVVVSDGQESGKVAADVFRGKGSKRARFPAPRDAA